MIQANELRIDNLLFDRENRLCKVEEISIDGLKAPAIVGPLTGLPHKPITLTEEILLKCGFVKKADNFSLRIKGLYDDLVYTSCINVLGIKGTTVSFIHIKYLHELQNLYFVLTGKELEVNL